MQLSRRILFVIFDQFELLDLSGPSSVFNTARALLKDPVYQIHVLSASGGLIRSRSGIEVNSQPLNSITINSTDTLMLVGGGREGIGQAGSDNLLTNWLMTTVVNVERVSSICSGAMLLAKIGLLDGKKATTHWADLKQMTQTYPKIKVQQDALYCQDGHTWTSAGVTTGIDMSLAMIGADHNHALSQEVARWLVVYVHRPGNQSQFSELINNKSDNEFSNLIVWIDQNIQQPIKVLDMADKLAMTERTFYRKFTDKIGTTPSKFLENRRLFRAKQWLEAGRAVKTISADVGYQSELGFRKAFEAKYGLSPTLYKRMHCDPNMHQ
jgi:transcriptional regulator GlxA family with amidase domain